jgi:GDP-L-fucose synthase
MSGRVEWDRSKPNGQAYRAYDLSKINGLGLKPAYSIREGLKETWLWYCAQHD